MDTITQAPESAPKTAGQASYTTPQLEKLGNVKQVTEGVGAIVATDLGAISL